MFSADNFYQYLNHYAHNKNELLQLYAFDPHGSRELHNLKHFGEPITKVPKRYAGRVALLDQEPIQLEYYTHWRDYNPRDMFGTGYGEVPEYYKSQSPMHFVFNVFAAVNPPILCHSERNSDEVELFQNNYFQTVHYFYHGLLAREWFRHWKHYSMKRDESAKRFGLYARDGSGSRAYRLDLIEQLTPYNKDVHFLMQPEMEELLHADVKLNWPVNPTTHSAKSSAIIDVDDCKRFQIQLVAETLFETSKTHLTEKVFKPMVMKQPFIVVGPPHSLQYLKDYGFRTFEGLWDEQYDREENPKLRMQMIMELVDHLSGLNDAAFDRIMDRTTSIVEFNHTRFFSHAFEDDMLLELHSNFNTALEYRNELSKQMPGGTWFHYQNQLLERGINLPEHIMQLNRDIFQYLVETGQEERLSRISAASAPITSF